MRTRDVLCQMAIDHELDIISREVSKDHIQMFISHGPRQNLCKIVQWLKGISSRILLSEFAHLRKVVLGRHLWARRYLAVSSGNITDNTLTNRRDDLT